MPAAIPSNHCRSMAKASRSSIQGALGRGEGFGIGTGCQPKSHQTIAQNPRSSWARGGLWDRDRGPSVSFETRKKTRQGASRNPIKPLPQHLGRGEGFEIATEGHPSVLKSHKTRQGASRNPSKPSHKAVVVHPLVLEAPK